jgi:hypothetical protein
VRGVFGEDCDERARPDAAARDEAGRRVRAPFEVEVAHPAAGRVEGHGVGEPLGRVTKHELDIPFFHRLEPDLR